MAVLGIDWAGVLAWRVWYLEHYRAATARQFTGFLMPFQEQFERVRRAAPPRRRDET